MTGNTAPAYSVARDGKEIVVRLRSDLMSQEEVSRFLDYLFLEDVRRRAMLSDAEIAALADEVDRAAWDRLRPMVEEKLRGR